MKVNITRAIAVERMAAISISSTGFGNPSDYRFGIDPVTRIESCESGQKSIP